MKYLLTAKLRFLIISMLIVLQSTAYALDTEGETQVLTELEIRMKEKITIDFRDMPIEDVVRVIAKQADVDIIMSPNVIGNVTATLTEVPLEEALDNILASQGYGYVTSKNMIRIAPYAELNLASQRIVTRIYQITYADVSEVEKTLRKFISSNGSISANLGTNNIIVSDGENKIKAIDEFIEEIDRQTPQILVEARIYDVTNSEELDLGVEWFAGRNTTFDENGNASGGRRDPFIFGDFSSGINQTSSTEALLRFGILNSAIDLDIRLHAEQEESFATLLANPRLLVLDHHEAHIKIVEEIPYQELTQTSGGGNIGSTEFKDVGVELFVTPHLARDGMIRLELLPKFSTRAGNVPINFPSSGETPITSSQPIVNTRETETTTLIRDGQTVVIGGLRKKDVTQFVDKIPLLGDLPLLGGLFRFEGDSETTSELLVFITPKVITNPVLSNDEKSNLEATSFDMIERCDQAAIDCLPTCRKHNN